MGGGQERGKNLFQTLKFLPFYISSYLSLCTEEHYKSYDSTPSVSEEVQLHYSFQKAPSHCYVRVPVLHLSVLYQHF